MKICIVNGPNLNLLGTREPSIYGSQSMELVLASLQAAFPNVEFKLLQSNLEGELINFIHEYSSQGYLFIINAGGYSHTSVALADAVKAVNARFVEVHISNIYSRESFRHTLLLAPHALGIITGFGLNSYRLAAEYLLRFYQEEK
ncbi:MAG: 3-dehydroquinate dehydratase [Flavobacteriales bacterium]|nr:3-dehydroquinate dehydratase [Flavobacteriales bacterium]